MTNNPFSLENKTILVTGASSGIGRSTAVECSKMGATVILTARNEKSLQDTQAMLVGEGHSYIIADQSKEADIDQLVDSMPAVDGLVNNAGLNETIVVPFIKVDKAELLINVNLVAPIMLTQKVLKRKKINKNSSIVFTSSIASKGFCSFGNSLYSASKGGLSSFMRSAAFELASKKIRCNAVLPGLVETPLKEGKTSITEEQWEINRQLYPLKRFGRPEDVAYAIVYLLSDASSWMTGSELVIDGGRSLK